MQQALEFVESGGRLRVKDPTRTGEARSPAERIAAAKDAIADAGIAHREHFRLVDGVVVVRRMPAQALRVVADYNHMSIAELMADPRLRLDAVDLERRVENLMVTAGLEFIVDAFQDIVELELMRFHAVGTGTTAPVVGNTTLETENLLGNANRPSGTQTENGADTYQTVATITKIDAIGDPLAVTEAGIFSINAAGVLLSRQTFAAVNVSQNDAIETTWEYTVS